MRIAIIPARRGSKRIPNKNIKAFYGKPIIAYSIETALQSRLFDKVIVSTDSMEIANVAEAYGAEVPFIRTAELATDYIGTGPVMSHAVQWFLNEGILPSEVCCIYATAPLLQKAYLREGLIALQQQGVEISFSACEFSYSVFRGFSIGADNRPAMLFPEYFNTRSQDLTKVYHDAGQFYWGTTEAFLKGVLVFSSISAPVVLPHYLVQDIDTHDDWYRAELLYQKIRGLC